MGILGKITHQIIALDEKSKSITSDFDKGSREKWKSNEEKGIGSMHQLLQNSDPPKGDESLLLHFSVALPISSDTIVARFVSFLFQRELIWGYLVRLIIK